MSEIDNNETKDYLKWFHIFWWRMSIFIIVCAGTMIFVHFVISTSTSGNDYDEDDVR